MVVISDAEELFMPVDSEAIENEKFLKSIYNESTQTPNFYLHQLLDLGKWAEINFLPCSSNADQNDYQNILEPRYFEEINRINDYVLKNTFVRVNETFKVGFEDVCARRNGRCTVEGADLLSRDFYIQWLAKSMQEKTRVQKEAKENKKLSVFNQENG
jgi:hypothetical protein